MPNSLLDLQITIPVFTTIPLLPLPETPQEVIPLAPAIRRVLALEVIPPPALAGRRVLAVEVTQSRLRKRNCKY
jgi:hypothetical protein